MSLPLWVPIWERSIRAAAAAQDMPSLYLAALVWQESNGGVRPGTAKFTPSQLYRYEPAFWDRYLADKAAYAAPSDDPETVEAWKRRVSASYGLCQIMYATARDFGWKGEPEGLFEPQANLRLGARLLTYWKRRYDGEWERALLRYNGGGNPHYPSEVLNKARILAREGWRDAACGL